MTRKVILEDNDGEELIPYTNLATSSEAGRIRPDNSTVAVDANGVISVNGVTGGEIGYLSGVTSAIQTQLNGKQGTLTFDSTPTAGSTNPVTSGGVYTAIQNALDNIATLLVEV